MPYGSANINPRGDTPLRGRLQGLPYAAVPDFSSYESPQNYFTPRNTFIHTSRGLRFGHQNRQRRVVTFRHNLTDLPSR
jgi:hypothetical protein